MTHYLIIDDEPIAHRIIESFCKKLPFLEKHGNCYNAFEAMQYLQHHTVDLIFLDINMPQLSGFEFLKTLSYPPKVIVTTAYQEFALEGYELNVSDYLLKPFSFERFVKAINKTILPANPQISAPKASIQSVPTEQSIFLKGDKKHHQVHFEDLLFAEAYGHYIKVHLTDGLIISHQKISDFEQLLPEQLFIRAHKSFVVAKNKITLIEGNRIFIDQHEIPIGQTYKANINKLIG